MSKETLVHVGLLEHDISSPVKSRHIYFGRDVNPNKAKRQAYRLQKIYPELRGFLFIEENGKPATREIDCKTCNSRSIIIRMNFSEYLHNL